jgi:hypothetical protein
MHEWERAMVGNLGGRFKGTVKIFDPRDGSTGSGGDELIDCSVVRRNDQWWMYLAGQAHGQGAHRTFLVLRLGSVRPWLPLDGRRLAMRLDD